MSEIIQTSEQDDSRVDRRSLLRLMGAGALGSMLGAGCTTTSEVNGSEEPGGDDSETEDSAPQLESCGTALGTVVDPGGRDGFANAAVNVLVPPEPQPTLTGLMMLPEGAITAEVRLDEASLDSIVSEGIPDVQEQLEAGGGFELEMEDGKQITADRLFQGSGGSIQFMGVETSFAEGARFNVVGFPPAAHSTIDGLGSLGQSGLMGQSGTSHSSSKIRRVVQGWEIALIFGTVVVITFLACAYMQYQAARQCDDVAVVEGNWSWFEGLTCRVECQ